MSPSYAAVAAALDGTYTEKAWSQVVVDYAQLYGWLVYRTWNSIHSPKGFPDLALVRSRRLVFSELKAEKGRVSPNQAAWLAQLAEVPGVEVYLWRPSDWPKVRDLLL